MNRGSRKEEKCPQHGIFVKFHSDPLGQDTALLVGSFHALNIGMSVKIEIRICTKTNKNTVTSRFTSFNNLVL